MVTSPDLPTFDFLKAKNERAYSLLATCVGNQVTNNSFPTKEGREKFYPSNGL